MVEESGAVLISALNLYKSALDFKIGVGQKNYVFSTQLNMSGVTEQTLMLIFLKCLRYYGVDFSKYYHGLYNHSVKSSFLPVPQDATIPLPTPTAPLPALCARRGD